MIYSFEVFPPKPTTPVEQVTGCFEALSALKPDFISVTYGAGGGLNGGRLTCELAARLKNEFGVKPVAHLPCISYTKEEISADTKENSAKTAAKTRKSAKTTKSSGTAASAGTRARKPK